MSFILDALKKSESDRQRNSGPALFEVKVAARRSAWPAWGIALAALLAVNLGVVAWMLLRHPAAHAGNAAGFAAAASVPAAHTAAAPVVSAAPAPNAAPAAAASAPAGAPAVAPVPAAAPALAAARTASPGTEGLSPDDVAPAAEPAEGFGGHVRRGTAAGVPLYQDAASAPGAHLPQLRLDLHVFATRPQDRFVMINMHKLREGDSLPEGVHVESILPEGAVLSYNGTRFLLTR